MTQAPSIDPAEVAKFARIADQWWAPGGDFAPLHKMTPARIGVIRDLILGHFGLQTGGRRALTGLSVLDVGCGGGLACEPLARLGAEVTGLDAAPEAIAAASAHAAITGLTITYKAGAAEDLAARGAQFDVVLALEIIEHVAEPAAFLKTVAALARPGGLVVVSTINRTAQAYALALIGAERILRWLPAGSHEFEKLVKPEELARWLEAAGLNPGRPIGVALDPIARSFQRSKDVAVNYLMAAGKPA